MREVAPYKKYGNGMVSCAVCPHRCRISEGRRGRCFLRENQGGRLLALNYGYTVASAVDPIEKKPLYHFLPGSLVYSFAAAGCNMHCPWCQNWQVSQIPRIGGDSFGSPASPAEHVRLARAAQAPSIAYTYGEPTMFIEYALDTMKLAHEAGLKNIWVSNGYITMEALELILPYLDAANIDLKGPDDAVYARYCGAQAEPVLAALRRLCQTDVHLELTTLIVPGVNDAPQALTAMAEIIAGDLGPDIPWHISRFFPAWRMSDEKPTSVSTLELARNLGHAAGLHNIYLGNV
ncbi:MAG: AmmeMemoRadiSam system radical SAM enzyme [Clostridia bacterium]|nr:AmmeMemoRadiSam system radical SAM enzyme [Clostridia bacterium]